MYHPASAPLVCTLLQCSLSTALIQQHRSSDIQCCLPLVTCLQADRVSAWRSLQYGMSVVSISQLTIVVLIPRRAAHQCVRLRKLYLRYYAGYAQNGASAKGSTPWESPFDLNSNGPAEQSHSNGSSAAPAPGQGVSGNGKRVSRPNVQPLTPQQPKTALTSDFPRPLESLDAAEIWLDVGALLAPAIQTHWEPDSP
jgi:hypothetical protein